MANRLNLYSVDPLAYERVLANLPLLKAIAVVYYFPSTERVLKTEEAAVRSVPFDYFGSVQEAIEWGLRHLGPITGKERPDDSSPTVAP